MFTFLKGYYIHDCIKMKYKANYQPSFLLDPVSKFFIIKSSNKVIYNFQGIK